MRLSISAAIAAATAVFGVHYVITGVVTHLRWAAADQCLSQSWPEHQREAHLDFCKTHGHPVGTLYVTGEYTGR